jgi:predicted methyltransferase
MTKYSVTNYRRLNSLIVFLLCATLGATSAWSQTTATPAVPERKTSTPYTGDLSIFDYPEREQKLHISQVMDLLGISPGKGVADIGAGSGWFTVRAARRVTETGKVYAVEINPAAITFINDRAQKEKLSNIKTVLGTEDDPRLPPGSVDAVLLLKTYHEVAKPVALMRNLRAALRPGARVGIIDRNGSGTDHGVQKKVVLAETQEAGYRLLEEHDELVKDDKMDYFLIFVAK